MAKTESLCCARCMCDRRDVEVLTVVWDDVVFVLIVLYRFILSANLIEIRITYRYRPLIRLVSYWEWLHQIPNSQKTPLSLVFKAFLNTGEHFEQLLDDSSFTTLYVYRFF